jgi:hypothetical protein
VTTPATNTSAAELLARARDELVGVARAIRAHPFLDELEAGRAPRAALETMAAEQQLVIASDRRSFAQLAARFPSDPAGAFFLSMAEGEGVALGPLADHCAALAEVRA